MRRVAGRTALVAALVVAALVTVTTAVEYTNQFAVVVPGGWAAAERAAAKHGCVVVDSIGDLTDHYLFECHTVHKRSTQHSRHHTDRLRQSDEILWADQQYYKTRKKRDGSAEGGGPSEELLRQASEAGPWRAGAARRASLKEDPPPEVPADAAAAAAAAEPAEHRRSTTAADFWPDPLFKEQWYLNGGARDGSDMNVLPAWQQGFRGKGVVVSILDDGIQPNHPDLAANYDARASLDINDDDDDPTPRDDGFNRHGTRCAGEVAAIAGNQYCGVGVAPNASIGGVRMLDGGVNDYVEAKALSLRRNYIDVYSASWGPEDDGKTVDGPGPLARRAFIEGAVKGRGGKGSIFVWASGNGGRYEDDCNCDGYTNAIFTLSISSATQGGKKPWYLEECASTLATTYSSGLPPQDKSIATCDQDAALRPKHICTVSHTGTSASAPLAAGIIALALEANPELNWRDMQYLAMMTSRPEPLAHEQGWRTNGVGRRVSHKFGYGLMDAGAMVDLAKRWTTVPTQHICIMPMDSRTRRIPSEAGGELVTSMEVSACQGSAQAVNYLEHVQCKVTLSHVPRGALRILLTSPSGTVSTLLFERPQDVLGSSFDRWPFMSVHFWGERPHGVWNLTVINTKAAAREDSVLKEWQLVLYGTDPEPVKLRPPEGQSEDGTGRAAVVSRSRDSSLSAYCSHSCVLACQSQPAASVCKHCRDQYKSACQRTCDPGTYYGGESGCQPCHSTCATCLGKLANQCLDCAGGHYLISDLSVCVQACPDGYFIVNETCQTCGPHCTACDGSANNCVSCAEHLILHNSQCVASCPAGTYQVGQRCERCAAGCETCVGPTDTNCVLCRPGLLHSDGQCVSSCPPGTFGDALSGECVACWPGCDLCSGVSVCQQCARGWIPARDGSCQPDNGPCPEGQYYNGDSCGRCHASCRVCTGPMSVECTRCQPNAVLHNGLCYSDCPEGWWSEHGTCRRCHHTCQDCRDRRRCSVCREGLLVHEDACVAACPPWTYQALDECLPCTSGCARCTGPRGDECVSCGEGLLLVQGRCVTSCPDGYHPTTDGTECQRCHRSCRTCKAAGVTGCTSCPTGYQVTSSVGGACVPCDHHEFSAGDGTCRPCHPTCATCRGDGPENCTSCAGELRLERQRWRCVPCCHPVRHADDPDSCCPCDDCLKHCVRGTWRRTVDAGYQPQPPDAGDSAFAWFYLQAAGACAATLLLFVLIFAGLQCHGRSRRRAPVLELTENEERLALTEYRNDDNMDELSDSDEHLVVFDSRT